MDTETYHPFLLLLLTLILLHYTVIFVVIHCILFCCNTKKRQLIAIIKTIYTLVSVFGGSYNFKNGKLFNGNNKSKEKFKRESEKDGNKPQYDLLGIYS